MKKMGKKLSIWKDALKRMNEEDLEFILDFPECFDAQILKLVNIRLKELYQCNHYYDDEEYLDEEEFDEEDEEDEEIYKYDEEYEEETTENTVISVLNEMGCPYETDEDGDINFEYQGENFSIIIDEDGSPFIDIIEYYLLTVSMDNYDEVTRLYHAINYTNRNGHVNAFYSVDEEKREIYVHFISAILFCSDITDLKGYMELMLSYFFITRQRLEEEMNSSYKMNNSNNKLN